MVRFVKKLITQWKAEPLGHVPTENMQGGISFYNINTWRVISQSRGDYTILPTPEDVITIVKHLGRQNDKDITIINPYGIVEEMEEDDGSSNSAYEEESSSDEEEDLSDGHDNDVDDNNSNDSDNDGSDNDSQEEIVLETDDEAQDNSDKAFVDDQETDESDNVGTTGVESSVDCDSTGVAQSSYGRIINKPRDDDYTAWLKGWTKEVWKKRKRG